MKEVKRLKGQATADPNVEFDENGKRRRPRGEAFVPFLHRPADVPEVAPAGKPPPGKPAAAAAAGKGGGGGGKPAAAAAAAAKAAPPPKGKAAFGSDEWKAQWGRRKFLFPLLDQGPNNQYLQFRVAMSKAHSLNRTLVLPVWLPHNPKFQHYHPGAPPQPSRDRRLDRISYPFESTFEPEPLEKYVRTIALKDFRALTDGKLERCLTDGGLAHAGDFDSYLRLSGMDCGNNYTETDSKVADRALSTVRFLGYHSYDRDLGMRERYYEFLDLTSYCRRHSCTISLPLTALPTGTTSSSTGVPTSISRRSGRSPP